MNYSEGGFLLLKTWSCLFSGLDRHRCSWMPSSCLCYSNVAVGGFDLIIKFLPWDFLLGSRLTKTNIIKKPKVDNFEWSNETQDWFKTIKLKGMFKRGKLRLLRSDNWTNLDKQRIHLFFSVWATTLVLRAECFFSFSLILINVHFLVSNLFTCWICLKKFIMWFLKRIGKVIPI